MPGSAVQCLVDCRCGEVVGQVDARALLQGRGRHSGGGMFTRPLKVEWDQSGQLPFLDPSPSSESITLLSPAPSTALSRCDVVQIGVAWSMEKSVWLWPAWMSVQCGTGQ